MEITAAVREKLGTANAGRVRNAGEIPGVVYGKGKPTEHITVNAQDFGRLVLKEGTGKLLKLKLQKGKAAEQDQVLIKLLQRHPVKGNIIHVDFLRVAMDDQVNVKVPLYLAGDERKTRDGSMVEVLLHELEISCLPSNIPDRIQYHTKNLTSGEKMQVKDLELGNGIKALTPLEETVAQAVSLTEAVETETPETGVAEPEIIKEKKEEA